MIINKHKKNLLRNLVYFRVPSKDLRFELRLRQRVEHRQKSLRPLQPNPNIKMFQKQTESYHVTRVMEIWILTFRDFVKTLSLENKKSVFYILTIVKN